MDDHRPLTILSINSSDQGGGAERTAYWLHRLYRAAGHASAFVVGNKKSSDTNVFEIDNTILRFSVERLKAATARRLGWQDSRYPGSRRISALLSRRPDVIHIHNMHGEYFDISALAKLALWAPTIVHLHDQWALTGHCAYSLGCDRWRIGCGQCPDLNIYPSVARDATAFNWKRKAQIFSRIPCWVTAPSRWLIELAQTSYLRRFSTKLVYSGVPLDIFIPGSQARARKALDLPQNRRIIMFSSTMGARHPFKDFSTLVEALGRLFAVLPEAVRPLLMVLGNRGDGGTWGALSSHIVEFDHVQEERIIAQHYQAADILVHATKTDNCPLVVLEALACGRAVVASAVGGVTELIEDRETGLLVEPGDPESLMRALETLLLHDELVHGMEQRARAIACTRFDVRRQATDYLDWYYEIVRSPEAMSCFVNADEDKWSRNT